MRSAIAVLSFLITIIVVLLLWQSYLHIQALDIGLAHYEVDCAGFSIDADECDSQLEEEFLALQESGGLVPKFISMLETQSLFVVLAFVVVAVSLGVATLFGIWLEWMENERGFPQTAKLILNILDTVPYAVWLILVLSLWTPVLLWFDDRGYGLEGVISGQIIMYLGVFLLLLPLFLTLILHKIRAARREHFFDAMAMDGFGVLKRYRKVIRHRLAGTLFNLLMFSTAFVIMFDATLITLIGGSNGLPSGTAVLDRDFPEQFTISPFGQLAVLEKEKNRGIIDIEALLREKNNQACKTSYSSQFSWMCYGPVSWVSDMVMFRQVKNDAHQMKSLSKSEKQAMMFRYPGLRLRTDWWREYGKLLINDCQDQKYCDQMKVCKNKSGGTISRNDCESFQTGERQKHNKLEVSQNIPKMVAKSAQWNGMTSVYFYYVLAIISLLFGIVVLRESYEFMGKEDE